MWMPGKSRAHMTAKIVIASAERLIDVRHFWRKRNKIAEISVPAWPIPIQKTKLVMSKAQPTGWFRPQTPIPCQKSQEIENSRRPSIQDEMANSTHHPSGVAPSAGAATASGMGRKAGPPAESGGPTTNGPRGE